jgi:predicted nucleic acid-binding Zn ribbon protein
MTISPFPKCRNCGVRLVTQMEINGYNGYCKDCNEKNRKEVSFVYLVTFAIVAFLIVRIFFF